MEVRSYCLENEWIAAKFVNYGARIASLVIKEKNIDIIHGCGKDQDFLSDKDANFGAVIGRYANRIANGTFSLNQKEYHLPQNDGANCLHGGPGGFAFQFFSCMQKERSLICQYRSPDGEQGFPGEMVFTVTYTLDKKVLLIDYQARCDQDTVCNFTNHAYFNLNGSGSVLGHLLTIDADSITPVDEQLIPLPCLMQVEGSPFDFRQETEIGLRIGQSHPQLLAGNGYDHNYVLRGSGYRKCASLFSETSGIRMDVYTDMPGLQLYTSNFMKSERPAIKGGRRQIPREAVCLETQFFPNSPNRPDFPSCVLPAGQRFASKTSYQLNW